MAGLNDLAELIRVLRPGEKGLIKHLYSRNSNKEDKLRLKLFELIEANKDISDAKAKTLLGAKGGPSAYSHLKRRLKEDILNALLQQEADKRFGEDFRIAAFECRKKLTQAYVLMFRGAYLNAIPILKQAEQLTVDYELPLERIMIAQLYRESLHTISNYSDLEKKNNAISEAIKQFEALNEVEEFSLTLSAPQLFKDADKESLRFQSEKVNLEESFKKFPLARIGFWKYLTETENLAKKGDFKGVVDVGRQFLKLIEESPSIKSKNNIAGVNQTIGQAHLSLRQYAEAERHLKPSVTLFRAGGVNQLTCMEMLFRVLLLGKRYEAALNIVKDGLKHPRVKAKAEITARWHYFHSCLLLAQGDMKGGHLQLSRNAYLNNSNDAWSAYYRLNDMLQFVRNDELTWLEYRIDQLRKLIAAHPAMDIPRVKAMLRLFAIMVRIDSIHIFKDREASRILDQLRSEVGDFAWDPNGPELFRIDLWLWDQGTNN